MKPIVSKNTRIRYPDRFQIGDDSIVDDFCYISTAVVIGVGTHINNNCSIAGGPTRTFTVGDFCTVSAGTRVWVTSNDYVNDIVALEPRGMTDLEQDLVAGDVVMGNYTAVGCNTVLMPGCEIPEGTVVGMMSYVPAFAKLEPWSVYAGAPARKVKPRNREKVERQVEQLRRFIAERNAKGST